MSCRATLRLAKYWLAYDIGCTTCKVGICLLKDVVSIHGLSKEDEAKIEQEINEHLAKKGE